MSYLVDSGVFLRLLQTGDPEHEIARSAIEGLWVAGEALHYSAQVLAEFWSVATRPADARGGYGLPVPEADAQLAYIERQFPLLREDTAAVIPVWRRLVVEHGVQGKQVHDSRLVAAMVAGGVSHLLTFNVRDFGRYTGIITAVHPADFQAPDDEDSE